MDVGTLTKELIALPTVAGKVDYAAPEFLSSTLNQLGYTVSFVKSNEAYHLLATQGEAPLHLAFISHYDVLPAGEGWSTDPFTPSEATGSLYGRGAADMKSGLAAQLLAGKILAEKGLRVSLFISGDARTTDVGMPQVLAANRFLIDYAIGGEPTSREKSGDTIIVGRRGVVQGDITLRGTPGHSAYLSSEENANHQLWPILKVLSPTFYGETDDFEASVFHITSVSSRAAARYLVPSSATVSFDARLSPKMPIDQFISQLERRVQQAARKDVSVTIAITRQIPHYYTADQQFRSLLGAGVTEVLGEPPAFSCQGAISDARFFAAQHIPVAEIGVPGRNIYGADEHVLLAEIQRLQDCYVRIGEKILETERKRFRHPNPSGTF